MPGFMCVNTNPPLCTDGEFGELCVDANDDDFDIVLLACFGVCNDECDEREEFVVVLPDLLELVVGAIVVEGVC